MDTNLSGKIEDIKAGEFIQTQLRNSGDLFKRRGRFRELELARNHRAFRVSEKANQQSGASISHRGDTLPKSIRREAQRKSRMAFQ